MQTTTTTRTVTRSDLEQVGCTTSEIRRLEALRSSYDPFREFCENDQVYERLSFLKWMVTNGQFPNR